MRIAIGVVEDSDEDFAALSRLVTRGQFDIELERWARAEDLLEEVQGGTRGQWPDLFLVDLSLPGLDGVALVARLRADLATRPLPLFILSGSARPKDVERSYAEGASLYLTKPLDASHVQAAIDLLSATPEWRRRR